MIELKILMIFLIGGGIAGLAAKFFYFRGFKKGITRIENNMQERALFIDIMQIDNGVMKEARFGSLPKGEKTDSLKIKENI